MKGELTSIDLRADEHKEVARLLQHHLPDTEVWAYGSRVQGAARPASDLDLATFASAGQKEAVSRIREAFDESPLPFRVDLFVWDNVPEEFRKNIEEVRVVVQQKEKKNLPKGWKTVAIGEISEVIGGGTPSSKVDEYWGGSIPWLTPKDLSGYDFRRVKSGKRNITDSGLANSSARLLPKNTVLVTSRAPIGYVALADNEIATNQGFKSLILNDGYDPDFFYYLIKHNVPTLEAVSSGTTFKEISGKAFKQIKFNVPPLPEQKAIAHILGSLDDKIELNCRMNETLEAMAQALFKSWFVDFDPVIDNALAAGNTIPDELKERAAIRQGPGDKQKSLPDDIRRLFPSKFAYTEEMGWIPKGWEIAKLSDLADVTMGQSPPSGTYNDDQVGLPFYQGSTDFGFRFPSIRKFCSAPKRQAKKDDILLSVRAPVGDLNRAEAQCCIGRGLAAIRSKTGYSSWIFYRCRFLKKYFETFNSEGTVFGSMNGADLRAIKSVHPCKNTLKVYENITAAIDQSIRLRSGEIDLLGKLRDTLLPKLLSGEIGVEQAKQMLEDRS